MTPVINSNSESRQLWILGLIHSGTTIFWRAWQKDDRFLCFDEPVSGLGVLPKQNSRQSYNEFIRIFIKNPEVFWKYYSPLHPIEELDTEFSSKQVQYLRFLFSQSSMVVTDETHLHLHLPALSKITPEAYVVHLHRRASAFATSHLRPSWSRETTWIRRIVRRLRHEHGKRIFWSRNDFLPGMCRGEVIGFHPQSKFGLMLTAAGYDADRIMRAPTLVRLLAYWHYHYHYLEREGPRLFGKRFLSLPYETFANDPGGTMRRLYDWIGLMPPAEMDYTQVHHPKPSYRPGDRRWREAAKTAGFTDEEIETLL